MINQLQNMLKGSNSKTINLDQNGFTFQVPSLTAEMMKVNDTKSAKLMPLNPDLGQKLNILA